MSELLEIYKEAIIEDVKRELVNDGVDLKAVEETLDIMSEGFEEDLLEHVILNEAPKGYISFNDLRSIAGEKFKNFTNSKENVKAAKETIKKWNEQGKKVKNVKSGIKIAGMLKIAGIAVGLAAAAYVLYKALRKRLDKCAKQCKGDKLCTLKCKVNYQKGLITTLKKNKTELKKGGKLTDKREKAIDKAIKRAEEKIKKYNDQIKKLK